MTAAGRACFLCALGLAAAASAPRAHVLEDTECVEASDFIRNAALSRDGGYLEENFLARIEDDIAAIQAFPPQSRWVVQDEDDAVMLIGAVKEVFRHPLPAEEHQNRFLLTCRADYGETAVGPRPPQP